MKTMQRLVQDTASMKGFCTILVLVPVPDTASVITPSTLTYFPCAYLGAQLVRLLEDESGPLELRTETNDNFDDALSVTVKLFTYICTTFVRSHTSTNLLCVILNFTKTTRNVFCCDSHRLLSGTLW